MRCGTENVPGIIGFGKAAELARSEWPERAARARQLRDRFVEGVLERVPGTILNGPPVTGDRLPNNANLSVEHVEGEAMLLQLDMKGVAASSGSACTSGSLEASHVLLAMGLPDQLAHNSLRFSFGRENSEEDLEYLLEVFPAVVERLRKMAPGVPLNTL